MQRASRFMSAVTGSKRGITLTAIIALLLIAVTKFSLVRSLLRLGVPREILQAQDAIISGTLTATLIWVLLMAMRVRQRREQEQIRIVADLNHNIRNALETIVGSDYLRESDKAGAILESVERIDHALGMLLPKESR